MAKRFQLPCVRVHYRSTRGKLKFKRLSRSSTSLKRHYDSSIANVSDSDVNVMMSDNEPSEEPCEDWEPIGSLKLPSLYSVKQRITTNAWETVRTKLRDACVESSALPNGQKCVHCTVVQATMWCRRCGSHAYFCQECWSLSHAKFNIFHTPEIWENAGYFRPLVIPDRRIDSLPDHSCNSKRDVVISCLDEDGVAHGVMFATCDCELITVTLARSRLWPATPKHPRYAFSFDLLDWCEALLLECQVSLKDLCEALYYKCPYLVVKRRDVYESLIDSFEEYRYMKSQLHHLDFLGSELDEDNVCPACPKKLGTVITSMDALFGLPRKKSAGTSHREPLFRNLYFAPQKEVDDFVNQYSGSSVNNECNSFLAGNPLRSSIRYSALDETAVFGCACRHEMPLMFLSLKHGERLSYGIYILRKVLSLYPDTINVIMMYDIACTLQQHLKVHTGVLPSNSQSRLQLAIPAFHAYGHKAECQLSLSPLRCKGAGLSDGEGMERLWSFLRRFSRMTKEMRPSHRLDILNSALQYWGHKKKQILHESLVKRFQKAEKVKLNAQKNLHELAELYKLSDDNILDLVDRSNIHQTSTIPYTASSSWEYTYFLDLLSYYKLCDELSYTTRKSMKKKIENLISRILEKLTVTELTHGVSCRWDKDSDLYLKYLKHESCIRQNELRKQLRLATERRHFLLRQKAKYADGQKIANKLSKQITKITTTIRDLLNKHSDLCVQTGEEILSLSDVLNPDSIIWSCDSSPDISIPINDKHLLVQSFFEDKRADEELLLSKGEMACVINYYKHKIVMIDSVIDFTQKKENNAYIAGCVALLTKLRWSCELLLDKAQSTMLGVKDEQYYSDSSDSCSDFESSDID